jgi:nitric oxide synthase-interacting protein
MTQKYKIQEEKLKDEELKKEAKRREDIFEEFAQIEQGILPPDPKNIKYLQSKDSIDNQLALTVVDNNSTEKTNNEKAKTLNPANHLPSFWVPSLTPEARPEIIAKPASYCLCPEESHPLRLKQLIKVNFESIKGVDREDPNKVHNVRYQCPVCSKAFTNVLKTSLLKKCGHVFCSPCVNNFVKENYKCFVCSKGFSESDVISLQCGGTGFSSHGVSLEATKFSPCAWV